MSAEILIIDDNSDIREILNDLILEAGYSTRLAANYNQALTEIDKKLPDVAIIDVKLDKGDNDGIELLNHIKNKNNNLYEIINLNVELLKKIDSEINIDFKYEKNKKLIFLCDYEQISRVFFNLIKNSIESIHEKAKKTTYINKIINIEIEDRNDYINVNIIDHGVGFTSKSEKDLIKPYFTTKQNGSGLGLSIVNKIINDHNGSIKFLNYKDGAKIEILLPKNNGN